MAQCTESVPIRGFYWSVFGHFSRSAINVSIDQTNLKSYFSKETHKEAILLQLLFQIQPIFNIKGAKYISVYDHTHIYT